MPTPLKDYFLISTYHRTQIEAEESLHVAINNTEYDRGRWQLWHIKKTEYDMNYIIVYVSTDGTKFKERLKEVYLELLSEVFTL
jgi:hypothetical protein